MNNAAAGPRIGIAMIVGVLAKDTGIEKCGEEFAGRFSRHGDAEALSESGRAARQSRSSTGRISHFGIDGGSHDGERIGYVRHGQAKLSGNSKRRVLFRALNALHVPGRDAPFELLFYDCNARTVVAAGYRRCRDSACAKIGVTRGLGIVQRRGEYRAGQTEDRYEED